MSILVTGGTGKTATPLAHLLHAANIPFLLASRKGDFPAPYKGVKFDWHDPTTFENPFVADPNIEKIYIVVPFATGGDASNSLLAVQPFLDLAVKKGVKRFVLLSGSAAEKGGPAMGKVHEYLHELGLDYCVLRPSWFMGTNDSLVLPRLMFSAIQRTFAPLIWGTASGRNGP